jgi:hypothetical protein
MTPQQRIAELLAEAIQRFEGCVVTWAHANIYRREILAVKDADPKDVQYAIDCLRKLVTEK